MTGEPASSPENLERELLYYKSEYDEIGARLLRAQEDQGRVAREARRSRLVASLIREAHKIASGDITAEAIGEPILATVTDTAICERAAFLRRDPAAPDWFTVEHGLGATAGARVFLPGAPRFLFTAARHPGGPEATPLLALVDAPYVLWGFDAASGHALLLGNRTESNVHRPFESGDEELVDGTLNVYVDVLLRKLAEATLQQAKHAAEEANNARARFLATLSHELRTPLNAIIGFSELLLHGGRRTPEPPQRDEFARQILDAGRSLLSLVKDILDFSTFSNAGPRLRLGWVPVDQLLQTAQRAAEPEAAARGLWIAVLPSAVAWHVMIDYDKFRQILANLIGNAIKFSSAEGRIEIYGAPTAQGEFEIAVRDSGDGMAQEDVVRALEPFVQLDTPRRRQAGGAGLGLPISRQLAEAHRGRLLIESALGAGTLARVVLPANAARPALDDDLEQNDLSANNEAPWLSHEIARHEGA